MLAKDLVTDVIPRLKTSDTGAQALSWMDHFRISHLPVVNSLDFLGLISDADIYSVSDTSVPIGNHKLSLFSPYVFQDQHVYDVLELVGRLKLTVIPVLNHRKEFVGCITQQTLVQRMPVLVSADQPGAVVILTMTVHDYTLQEISRLVEENNARILSLCVYSPPETMELEVTIKTNTMEMASILRTFERFGYEVKATFREDEEVGNLYRSRYEEFMRYLNV